MVENALATQKCAQGIRDIRQTKYASESEKMRAVMSLTLQNRIPPQAFYLIADYIETNKLNWKLLQPPLAIINHAERTHVPSQNPKYEYQLDIKTQEFIRQGKMPNQQTKLNGLGLEIRLQNGATKLEVTSAIQEMWKTYIEPYLSNDIITGRRRVHKIKPSARDELVITLGKSGLNSNEIAATMYAKYDEVLTPYNIRKIISRSRQRDK